MTQATSFPRWWPAKGTDAAPAGSLWDELQSVLDLKGFRPIRATGILRKELNDKSGHHFLLKNSATHSYVRLAPEEFWIWQQMDGLTSVQQLVLAYFMEYKAFAFGAIVALLDRLREGHMLADPPQHIYSDVTASLAERSLSYKLSWVARTVFTKEFVIRNLDKRMDAIHRYGGWILFTVPVQIIFLLVSVIGTWLFIGLAQDPHYNLLATDGFLQLGLLAYIPLVIHEFGHAITAKHVGCEVYKGGVMLYYGLPAAFIDTTDVWFFGKRARLAVTWAGPYTGYIIGGACSIIVRSFPGIPLSTAVMLLQIAFVGILTSTINLLPLLKLDGYYLLADALEIPRLRERSMDFIAHGLRPKLAKREKWIRDDFVFLLFGLLAFLSTFYFTYAGVVFWDSQATTSIAQLFHFSGDVGATLIDLGTAIISVSAIYFAFALIAGYVRPLYLLLQTRGYLSTRWRAAAIMAVLAIALTVLPPILLPTLAFWLLLVVGISAFAYSSSLAFSSFISMRGSAHAFMWLPMSGAALFGAAGLVGAFLAEGTAWSIVSRAAALLLFAVSFTAAGRLLLGLRGSWRAVSMVLAFAAAVLIAVTMLERSSLELDAFASLLVLAGLIHWRMRPATQLHVDASAAEGSSREKIMIAFHEISSTILSEVALDFGVLSRKRVEDGRYRRRDASVGEAEFSQSMTGMTPNDYGGALALRLNELLASVERLGGKKYAWRALAYGYDKLQWEAQEMVEDYLLKSVRYAPGLSNRLSQAGDDIAALLRSIPLFMGMSDAMIGVLSKQLTAHSFKVGDEIVRAGDAGDSFYVVGAGKLEVVGTADRAGDLFQPTDAAASSDKAMLISTRKRRITQLTRGDYFGELALLEGMPRSATVRAVTPAEVFRLNKEDFDGLIRNSISFDDEAREELRRLGLLRQIPLFEGFDGRLLKSLVQQLEVVKVEAGETVFQQGESADKFYIIERGKVAISIDGKQRDVLGTGEYFGEIALLMNIARTATVTALQPLTLLRLSATDFNRLIQESALMKQALERASSRRALANDRWAMQTRLAQTAIAAPT